MTDPSRSVKLSQALVEFADTLVNEFDVVEFLHRLSDHCVELFELRSAAVLLRDDEQLKVMASSDEQSRGLELLELQNDQGPCLEAYERGEPVQATAAQARERWPAFALQAQAQGYSAVSALPLRLRGTTIGALNLFRTHDVALDEDGVREAQALADTAAIGLLNERMLREAQLVAEQMKHALSSRVVLEQAKGALASQLERSVDDAFMLLRTYARNNNLRLSAVSQQVVDGELSKDVFLLRSTRRGQQQRTE